MNQLGRQRQARKLTLLPTWSNLTNMNIFATDKNPAIAARNLCDKHINKMIVESANVNATLLNEAEDDCPRSQKGQPRTQSKASLTLELRDYDNFEWLCAHALDNGQRTKVSLVRQAKTSLNFIAWC